MARLRASGDEQRVLPNLLSSRLHPFKHKHTSTGVQTVSMTIVIASQRHFVVVVLVLLGAFLTDHIAVAQECAVDADCKPAACCHATACMPVEQAPSTCSSNSAECGCEPFTLDCGGRCFCTELKKCAAFLNLNSGGVSAGGGGGGGFAPAKRRKYTYGYTKVSVKK